VCVGLQGDWVEQAKVWGECANDDISCPDMYVAVPLTPCFLISVKTVKGFRVAFGKFLAIQPPYSFCKILFGIMLLKLVFDT
jgi:hypothetical protein